MAGGHSKGGGQLQARYLVSAVGQLHHPRIPDFDGLNDYSGPAFHTADWGPFGRAGGNAILPALAMRHLRFSLSLKSRRSRKKLTVYHRSPNWIIDKGDRPYSRLEKWIGKTFPSFCQALPGLHLGVRANMVSGLRFKARNCRVWLLRRQHEKKLKKSFPDDALRCALS